MVVTKDENHKKRLVIDYSQTINKFTLLDAFPLPRINDLIKDITQNRFLALLTSEVLTTRFLSEQKIDPIPHLKPPTNFFNIPASHLA